VRLLYRLGRQAASGVLTLAPPAARPEVYVLRRGAAVCGDGELAKRALMARLARSVAEPSTTGAFDSGVTAYPPGAAHQVAIAGRRLALRAELAPEALDDADRRMVAALAVPRRLDDLWSLARTPRFRLLAFVHFLGAVGALVADPAAEQTAGRGPGNAPHHESRAPALDPRRRAALQLLGVDPGADADTVKRAYRRLARALHPDLQPGADDQRRRTLERRFAEVTAAYEALV